MLVGGGWRRFYRIRLPITNPKGAYRREQTLPDRDPRGAGVSRCYRAVLPGQWANPASDPEPNRECQPGGGDRDPRDRTPNAGTNPNPERPASGRPAYAG